MHLEVVAGFTESPTVVDIHAHERRDMKFLAMSKVMCSVAGSAIAPPQNITMPLVPRRVVDLGDDEFNTLIQLVKDVEQIQRAHEVAAAPQLR